MFVVASPLPDRQARQLWGKARLVEDERNIMWQLHSSSDDPFHNLALEAALLSSFDDLGPGLLTYVNRLSVVLGKNQVPWRECDMALLKRQGIPLARRISGGGTVVHDPGNLNVSLFLNRSSYQADAVYRRFIEVLGAVRVAARLEHGNSLFAGNRKVSGQAFCYRRNAVLHHATFLVCSDLDQLRALLLPSLPEIETRAIASRPASVANLSELSPGLTVESLRKAVQERFAAHQARIHEISMPSIDRDRFLSEDWVIGQTPAFQCRLPQKDGTSLALSMKRGAMIDGAVLHTDAGPHDRPDLVGLRFDLDRVLSAG